jgi:hypothetical protein
MPHLLNFRLNLLSIFFALGSSDPVLAQENSPPQNARIHQIEEQLQQGSAAMEVLPKMVEIQLEYITLPHDELANLMLDFSILAEGDRLREALRQLQGTNKAWLSASSSAVTKFGQRFRIADNLDWWFATRHSWARTALQEIEPGTVDHRRRHTDRRQIPQRGHGVRGDPAARRRWPDFIENCASVDISLGRRRVWRGAG